MNARHMLPLLFAALWPFTAGANEVSVAVAANFTAPMKAIAEVFAAATGHQATLSFGSSGKFYAQITNGAPYEVFLSADQEKPQSLEEAGEVVPGSRFTYSLGALALWSADSDIAVNADTLEAGDINKLAIANPKLAPYGAAALEVMDKLGVRESLAARLIQGENIAQTYQFVSSGNARLGFVALSQVYADGAITSGSAWIVPDNLYTPIRQDAVLLLKGRDNPAAVALLDFLKGPQARKIMISYGYRLAAND